VPKPSTSRSSLTWTGVLGRFIAARRSAPPALQSRTLRRYLVGSVGLTLAMHLAMNLAIVNPQGRHLFAVAPQIAFVLAWASTA
jgi:hypothetical protein